MDAGEVGIGEDEEGGGRIELHRAGAEGDHRVGEREVTPTETGAVAHQLGLGVVEAEDLLLHEVVLATNLLVHCQPALGDLRDVDLGVGLLRLCEDVEEGGEVAHLRGLVEGDADGGAVGEVAEVAAALLGDATDADHLLLGEVDDLEGVEVERIGLLVAELAELTIENHGVGVDPSGDVLESLRSVIDGIHTGDGGEECLSGTDIGGGALALDVLLAGLEGEAEGLVIQPVDGHADDTSRDDALVLVGGGEVAGGGTAVVHRHTEAL